MTDSPIEELRTPDAIRHQRRAVRVERAGWLAMLLLVAAALAGLLGPGPLSHTSSQSVDGTMEVTFSRFIRSGTTTGLDITLKLADPSSEPRIRLDTDYLAAFSISDVRPTPTDVIARGGQLEFVFAAPQTSDVTIAFDLSAEQFGRRSGTVALRDGASVNVSHLIYP